LEAESSIHFGCSDKHQPMDFFATTTDKAAGAPCSNDAKPYYNIISFIALFHGSSTMSWGRSIRSMFETLQLAIHRYVITAFGILEQAGPSSLRVWSSQ
jgi:hypothetical protein